MLVIGCLERALTSSRGSKRAIHAFSSDARWPGWQAVIGIETHAQIKSRSKLFSQSLNTNDELPNTHVSLFDAAFPGTLPSLNPICVELGVRTAIALESEIQPASTFDRKHYFYHDLPSGYQITQKYAPLAIGGRLQIHADGRAVRIEQIQLEQDTAKSTNTGTDTTIDLNRAGAGLMEVVSRPDMRTPEEAGIYVKTLRAVLRAIGASDGNMEQGSLRCDVNISVNRQGEPFGTRCEVKNINSVRFLMSAILCEVHRHIGIISRGGTVNQETRGYNEERAETFLLRSKEDAPDYRYMPDPNLPPLLLSKDYVNEVLKSMPELPISLAARLKSNYRLSQHDTEALMAIDAPREVGLDGRFSEGSIVKYFEDIAEGRDPKLTINWITQELLGQLTFRNETFSPNRIPVATMRELLDLVHDRSLTGTSAKTLLRHILDTHATEPLQSMIDALGLRASPSDSASLNLLCQKAIDALPKVAESARRGNEKVIMRLVGYVMKESRGTADAKAVAENLRLILLPSNT